MIKIGTKEVIEIMPESIKKVLSSIENIDMLQEIRIKTDRPLIVFLKEREIILPYKATEADLKLIVQRISGYSIYAFEEEIKQGFITIRGGHRVGICGRCILDRNSIKTIKYISSLNIRICKEVKGCSKKIINYILNGQDINNTLIISPPKCGKTTIIRDISKYISDGFDERSFKGKKLCIVDERSEIAGCCNGVPQLDVGIRTDVLDGCPKSEGIMMAIRSMSPDVIVCDEIGTYKDVDSIIASVNCGIKLIASIHGYDITDIYKRPVFKEIALNNAFKIAVILSNKEGAGTVEYIYDIENQKELWRR